MNNHYFFCLGEFGVVYKGHLLEDGGNIVTTTVAIKTLKGSCRFINSIDIIMTFPLMLLGLLCRIL